VCVNMLVKERLKSLAMILAGLLLVTWSAAGGRRSLVTGTCSTLYVATRSSCTVHYQSTPLVAFRVIRRRREMYIGHARLCVPLCLSVCLSLAACPHYCTDPDVSWGNGRGCHVVMHYWADLQSVHGFRLL